MQPIFINDLYSIIEYINNKKNIKFISKKLLELIYNRNDLKEHHYIKYYAGNNTLIVEYENDNKAILFIDPLNQRQNKNINFILIKDEQKDLLFKNILSSKNNILEQYLKNIMTFDAYLNKIKNIMKLFIYFYYYEKELKEKQEYFFKKM